MTDIVDRKTRSRMMSGIRGKNTKPERLIRSGLHGNGFRFRIHNDDLAGKPDIVFKKFRAVIFVHGCFWHRHECSLFRWPETRPDFWKKKINENYARDQKVMKILRSSGWRVCIVWECAIRGKGRDVSSIIKTVLEWLVTEEPVLEIVR